MSPHTFPEASPWSLWIGIAGRASIFLSLLSMLCMCLLLIKKNRNTKPFFWVSSLSLTFTMICLGVLFVTHQFQYDYVFKHSDSITETIYQIASIWSGQEGSFLLWAACTSWFGTLSIKHTKHYQRAYSICFGLLLACLSGILIYESPFVVNYIQGKALIPTTGLGLQPSLLNPWIIIHPPIIFAGFASLTVLYAWAVAALAHNDLQSWVAPIRPWAILSITLLGLGLCLGGLWAYETLGWGGFWAWDPVENSSFVPWVLAIGFLHGIFVQNAKQKWMHRNLLTAAFTFISFLYGTFLTRSGILADTSVHSFAQMDRDALKLLVALGIGSFVAFIGFWIRSLIKHKNKQSEDPEQGWNRENGYGSTQILMSLIGFATALGMTVPLIKSFLGQSAAIVEAQVYHKVLAFFFIPLMIAWAITPLLNWKKEGFKSLLDKVWVPLLASVSITGICGAYLVFFAPQFALDKLDPITAWMNYKIQPLPWLLFLTWICVFTLITNAYKLGPILKKTPEKSGGYMMHIGVIFILMGLILSKGFERSEKAFIQQGHPAFTLGYWVRYEGFTKDPFDRTNALKLQVIKGRESFSVEPGFYYSQPINKPEPTPVSWPAIRKEALNDLYFSVGSPIYEATDIVTIKEKKDFLFDRILLAYNKLERKGEAGALGTKFLAHIEVKTEEKTIHVTPSIEIGEKGLAFHPVKVNQNLFLYLQGIDAKDNSAKLQLFYINPVYPIEVLFKPMTFLVWLGTLIMVVGGLISARMRFKNLKQHG